MKHFSLLIIRYKYLIIVIWSVIFLFSAANTLTNKNKFETGIGEINNSISKDVNDKLKNDFKETISSNLLVTFSSNKYSFESKIYQQLLKNLENSIRHNKAVRTTLSNLNSSFPGLSGKNGKTSLILIQMINPDFSYAESFVPEIRTDIKSFLDKYRNLDNSLKILVTGNAAFSYDMNIISERQGQQAEKRVLLLTFLVLIFAFRSLSAAFIAVITGFSASIITISLLKIISGYYNLSIFCQNVSTMLGLAFGIDYSLFLITRYRQELLLHEKKEALYRTLENAGIPVLYSGLTVLTGFMALFLPDLKLTNSIALGGSLVVLFSLGTALTVTPIMLFIFTEWLDFPRFLGKLWLANSLFNKKWATFITKNSLAVTLITLTVLILLSLPVFNIKLSDPDIRTMPDNMEAKAGFSELQDIASGDVMFPVYLLTQARKNKITESNNLVQLASLVSNLKKDERIAGIYSIVSLNPGFGLTDYLMIYNSNIFQDEFQFINNTLISKNKKTTLLQLFPRKNLKSYQINELVESLQSLSSENFNIEVGGPASVSHDLISRLYSSFPYIIGLVYLVTMLLLAFAFKSILIPLKAILVNTISLTASFGLMVLIFQYGYLNRLIGLEYSPESILSGIPVILFCIMFSLSMDYEVFLLSRINENYLETKDNDLAIISGLSETSEVITRAALIMLIVFGAFTLADIILIKMLGAGLTIAVFIDATIIRMMLVPAFMKLAGKANWYFPFGKSEK